MPPKMETWSSEKENILIFEVERRPMLWDARCETYKRTDLKYNQWHEIAQILGPSFSADMVQQRFISMRQTFMTNLRRERESKKRCSGKSPEEIYKPKWVLYDRLKFLIKSCVQAESISNLQTSKNTSYSDKTESLTNDNATQATESSENEIEYLESEFDITKFYLHNTQQWQTSSANTSESEMYCRSDDTSHFSKNDLSKASFCHHDSQLDILSNSSTAKLAVHTSAGKKQSSDNKENMYIKRGSAKKRKGSIIEEAIGAIKLLNEEKSENDSAEYFGVFVASRLREMCPEIRKQCEQEIMKCLSNH